MAKVTPSQLALTLYHIAQETNEKEIKKTLESFVEYVSKLGMSKQFDRIISALHKVYAQKNQEFHLIIESRNSLSDQQVKKISETYSKRLKAKKITTQEVLNEELIGGYKIRVLDEVFDNSIANSLKQLQDNLLTVKK